MTLWRGLSKRILVASILCGFVGLAASQIVVHYIVRAEVERKYAPFIEYLLGRYELDRCEAAPEAWSIVMANGDAIFAYDGATLTSRNPAAPPLHEKVLAMPPGARVEVFPLGPWKGGIVGIHTGRPGACAIVQGQWQASLRDPAVVRLFSLPSLVGAIAVASVAFAFAAFLVVRPFARRVQRLRRAAERVGDERGYAPAESSEDARERERDELAELSACLDRAHARIRADAARLLERQRDLARYLADVSHDLRTPIASLTIALEQAADATRDPATSALITTALNDAVYLGALTNNLRLASQLREGWSPVSDGARVDLTDAVERVVARVRFFAKRRDITLEVAVPDGPVTCACNPVAAEQAVGNIVENAVAYGDPGGHVAVVLERTGAASFALRVVDDGPGVPPTELPRLGERTFRTDDARQRDPRGTGLGLAITNEVCAACGWTLSFAGETPRGLRVAIEGATTPAP